MKKILIIDDEPDFCMLVQRQCIKAGRLCDFATTIADGLQLVKEFCPDVIILDNNLPDGSGWLNAPRLLHEYPQTIIHLVTARSMPNSNEFRLNDGTDRIFLHPKPLSLGELMSIIN